MNHSNLCIYIYILVENPHHNWNEDLVWNLVCSMSSKAIALEWPWLSCASRNLCHALCFTKTAGWKGFFKLFDGSKELFEVPNYFCKRASQDSISDELFLLRAIVLKSSCLVSITIKKYQLKVLRHFRSPWKRSTELLLC